MKAFREEEHDAKRKHSLYKCYMTLFYQVKPSLVLRVGFQPAKSLAARTADKCSQHSFATLSIPYFI